MSDQLSPRMLMILKATIRERNQRVEKLEEEIYNMRSDLATRAVCVMDLERENQRLRDLVKETLQSKIAEKKQLWKWLEHFHWRDENCDTCKQIRKAWRGE